MLMMLPSLMGLWEGQSATSLPIKGLELGDESSLLRELSGYPDCPSNESRIDEGNDEPSGRGIMPFQGGELSV